jgi:NADH-quinone oxidoreductase subunit J
MEPINWHSVLFFLFAALACGAAVAVVLCGNIVRMAFALVAALGAVAGLFFLAGADFLGALQLLVYVGGTVVLLVFGVMLTAQRPLFALPCGTGQWVAAVMTSACLLAVLLRAAVAAHGSIGPPQPDQLPSSLQPTTSQIGLALLGLRTDRLHQPDAVLREGISGYLLPLEIASVHLLVVLIGAVLLARTKRHPASGTLQPGQHHSPRPSDDSASTPSHLPGEQSNESVD